MERENQMAHAMHPRDQHLFRIEPLRNVEFAAVALVQILSGTQPINQPRGRRVVYHFVRRVAAERSAQLCARRFQALDGGVPIADVSHQFDVENREAF